MRSIGGDNLEEFIVSGVRFGLALGVAAFGAGFIVAIVLKCLNFH